MCFFPLTYKYQHSARCSSHYRGGTWRTSWKSGTLSVDAGVAGLFLLLEAPPAGVCLAGSSPARLQLHRPAPSGGVSCWGFSAPLTAPWQRQRPGDRAAAGMSSCRVLEVLFDLFMLFASCRKVLSFTFGIFSFFPNPDSDYSFLKH